jgi:hypothetical protein
MPCCTYPGGVACAVRIFHAWFAVPFVASLALVVATILVWSSDEVPPAGFLNIVMAPYMLSISGGIVSLVQKVSLNVRRA